MSNKKCTTLYYDGECPLCSREIAHYQKNNEQGDLAFKDITSEEFDQQAEGLSNHDVMGVFHIKTADGEILQGVNAFLHLWQGMNYYRRLVPILKLPIIRQLLELAYKIFAKYRHLLKSKKSK
jgi:predicted DCC family thiol-disulfide oxidoreductase YuxK